MNHFTVIPKPRLCLLQHGAGLHVSWDRSQHPAQLARGLRAGPDAYGFPIETLPLNLCCARFGFALPEDFTPMEGYVLRIAQGAVTIGCDSPAGRYYALATLSQIMATIEGEEIPPLSIIDYPQMETRAFNLCYHVINENLPSLAPNFETVMDYVEQYANMKLNAVVIEFESIFPFSKYPQLSASIAFSREEMERLRRLCEENFVEIIPLVQSLGHAYSVLRHPEFSHLREAPRTTQQYCPTNPQCPAFYAELIEEILTVFPSVKRWHLGGDESRRLGECPRCRKKIKEQGMGRLFGDHINQNAKTLLDKGITPMIWGDIFEEFDDVFDVLDKRIHIVYWNYDVIEWYRAFLMEKIMRKGFSVYCAPGAKFSFTSDYFYLYQKSMRNVSVLGTEGKRAHNRGMILTDWPKLCTYEVSYPSHAYAAQIAWGESIDQESFGGSLANLAFGVRIPEFDEICKNLSEISYGNIKGVGDCWVAPFSNLTDGSAVDGLDRFDQSRIELTATRMLADYTKQEESPKTQSFLKTAIARAERAQTLLSSYQGEITRGKPLFGLLLLAARTMLMRCRMGLILDDAVQALKFPTGEEEALHITLVARLSKALTEWRDVKEETRKALLPSNFEKVLDTSMKVRFPKVFETYLEGFASCLRAGSQLQELLTLKTYERE